MKSTKEDWFMWIAAGFVCLLMVGLIVLLIAMYVGFYGYILYLLGKIVDWIVTK